MRYGLVILFLSIGYVACAQSADEHAIVDQLTAQNFKDTYYSDNASIPDYLIKIVDSISKKNPVIQLSAGDLAEAHQKLTAAKNAPRWPAGYFKNMVSADSTRAIFADTGKEWPYFKRHYSNSLVFISRPVFIHNNTICFVASSWSADFSNDKEDPAMRKRFGDASSYSFSFWVFVKWNGVWIKKGLLFHLIT